MPGYSCSIKERMLYSSCKAPLLEYIENSVGIKIEKKVTYFGVYINYIFEAL